ncbi:MAG: FlgD immunoglobulin-like domain containing protein [Gemmatimonadota bacterium]|nr:FlgD immunoglobulin-like domain containing protein [Gemmatimonadota bacterium]
MRRTTIGPVLVAGTALSLFLGVRSAPLAPPKAPNEHFHLERAWPHADIPPGAHARALEQARAMPVAVPGDANRGTPVVWAETGPDNVGGRVTAVVVDTTGAAGRAWIGAADGGILRTTDTGTTWEPLLDDFGGLSIGALAQDPTAPGTLLAGTGEANASGDSYDGIGMLRTTDGGDSWAVTGLADSKRIARIAYDQTDAARIHVAVSGALYSKGGDRGMYRSTDGGASWHQTLFVSDSTSAIDVAIDPTDGNILYAAFWERMRAPDARNVAGPTSGIHKSTDGGDSWTLLAGGLPSPGPSVGRIGLSIAPSNPSTVYAIYADTPGYFAGVYKTTDAGGSWVRIDDGVSLNNLYSSFGWYFGNVRVLPANENRVYALGVGLYRSTDGGITWSEITGSQHVDMHDLVFADFDGNGQVDLVSGNDGGIYVGPRSGSFWTKKYDLPISQFYAVTLDPSLPHRVYGGTQDNGTQRTLTGNTDDWDHILGGDGFTCVVNPTNSAEIFAEYQWGYLYRSTDTGASFSWAGNGIDYNDRMNWHTPFVMDPSNPNSLYYGSHRVYRTLDSGNNWTPVSPDLTGGPGSGNLTFGTLTTLDVLGIVGGPSTVYTGSDDGNVHVTTDSGNSWTNISAGLPVRYVTAVAMDPASPAIAYVTHSGYREDVFLPHIHRTADYGATWTDITGNLPEAPVNDILPDPDFPTRLFVATDVGVYWTPDLGGVWLKVGTGLPLSVVTDIDLHPASRTLLAGTHGRSAFRADISTLADGTVTAEELTPAANAVIRLSPPSPNPSRGAVSFSFSVPDANTRARLSLVDVAGRLVRVLHDGPVPGGSVNAQWDGTTETGTPVSPGVYFAQLMSAGELRTRKAVRIR